LMKLWLRLVLNIFGYELLLRSLKTKWCLDSAYQKSKICS
jgi:hypothetical protein